MPKPFCDPEPHNLTEVWTQLKLWHQSISPYQTRHHKYLHQNIVNDFPVNRTDVVLSNLNHY